MVNYGRPIQQNRDVLHSDKESLEACVLGQ